MADTDEAPKSFFLDPAVHRYLVSHGSPPDDVAQRLTAETRRRVPDRAGMQVAPEQSALLTLLTRLLGARLAVEVGTFTGTSALAIARGLAPGGRLICCDVSEEWTAIGRPFWAEAGVEDRIEVRIGPAIGTLHALAPDPPVDLAFIDAHKSEYVDYWEALVPRLRPGGVLVVDNVLWGGAVADPTRSDDRTEALRRFNDHAAADGRMESVMLPLADGVTISRKRS